MGPAAMKIYNGFAVLLLVVLGSFMAVSSTTNATGVVDTSTALLIRVDPSGNGDFKKIQDAIDSVPSNNSELVFIWVKPATYRCVCERERERDMLFDFPFFFSFLITGAFGSFGTSSRLELRIHTGSTVMLELLLVKPNVS